MPTLTSPTTRFEFGARTGTFARTDVPSVPDLPVHHLVAGQRLRGIGADVLTEFVSVGMGQPDALIVGDHHEQKAGALLDLGGQLLQLPIGQFGGERRARRQRGGVVARDVGADRGGEGDRARDIQRLVLVLGGEAVVAEEGEHPAGDAQRERHHGDLQHQHLGGKPHIHAPHPRHGKSVQGCVSTMRKSSRSPVARVVRTSEPPRWRIRSFGSNRSSTASDRRSSRRPPC